MTPAPPIARVPPQEGLARGGLWTLLCLLLWACVGPGAAWGQGVDTPADLEALVGSARATPEELYFEVVRLAERQLITPESLRALQEALDERERAARTEADREEDCRTTLANYLRRTLSALRQERDRAGEVEAELWGGRGLLKRQHVAGVREGEGYAEGTVVVAGMLGMPTSKGDVVLLVATAGGGYLMVKVAKVGVKKVVMMLRKQQTPQQVAEWARRQGHVVEQVAGEAELLAAVKERGGRLPEEGREWLKQRQVRVELAGVGRELLSARPEAGELAVLARVVRHLRPESVGEVEERWRRVARGGVLSEGEWARMKELAREVDEPLSEAAQAMREGRKVAWLGLRRLEGGGRLQLVWGQPYKFVEVKAWKELSLTGNVKAMIDYVNTYGGYLELWVRSSRHPEGATRLTEPLLREMIKLERQGKGKVRIHP